jgi:hypothetical protein
MINTAGEELEKAGSGVPAGRPFKQIKLTNP